RGDCHHPTSPVFRPTVQQLRIQSISLEEESLQVIQPQDSWLGAKVQRRVKAEQRAQRGSLTRHDDLVLWEELRDRLESAARFSGLGLAGEQHHLLLPQRPPQVSILITPHVRRALTGGHVFP